jgi:hypothetical protein
MFIWEYQQRKLLGDLGFKFDAEIYFHELKIFSIIDREWKLLEAQQAAKANKRRR